MNELQSLDAFAADLIAGLGTRDRAQLARRIATQLRESQQKRIAAQINPDGSGFTPRKQLRDKKGKLRRQMFAKLRTARYIKSNSTADAAIVAFTANVSRIARVHQFGLRDRVNKKTCQEITYARRELLGISGDDEALISELVTAHLAERL